MKTECTREYRSFQALGRREIVADFSGGTITSDGGALLLREVEQRQLSCNVLLNVLVTIVMKIASSTTSCPWFLKG